MRPLTPTEAALLQNIRLANWDAVSSLLLGSGSRSEIRRFIRGSRLVEGLTLHYVSRIGGAPPEVMRLIIEASEPNAPGKRGKHGRTPLHMACSARATVGALRELVRAHPAALAVRDDNKMTPLHRAILLAGNDFAEEYRAAIGEDEGYVFHEIVRTLLEPDPGQVWVWIRKGAKWDRPFHLLMARAHNQMQHTWCKALLAAGVSEVYHEEYALLEHIMEAAFLVLKIETEQEPAQGDESENGSETNAKGKKRRFWKKILKKKKGSSKKYGKNENDDSPLTCPNSRERAQVFQAALQKAECPNIRLFLYLALWAYPELAAASFRDDVEDDSNAEAVISGCHDGDGVKSDLIAPIGELKVADEHPVTPMREWQVTDEDPYMDRLVCPMHLYNETLELTMACTSTSACDDEIVDDEEDGDIATTAASSSVIRPTQTLPLNAAPPLPSTLLHAALLRSRSSVRDAHSCVVCGSDLAAEPHFVSMETGESCDLGCAHRRVRKEKLRELKERRRIVKGGTEGNGEGDGDNEDDVTWFELNRDRHYMDITVSVPYGRIISRLAALYPQSSAVPFSAPPSLDAVDNPDASRVTAGHVLPLHAAVACGHTWHGSGAVRAICEAYPSALAVRDPRTGLYPFMGSAAAARGSGTDHPPPGSDDDGSWERRARYLLELDTCYELLRAMPGQVAEHLRES